MMTPEEKGSLPIRVEKLFYELQDRIFLISCAGSARPRRSPARQTTRSISCSFWEMYRIHRSAVERTSGNIRSGDLGTV